MVTNITSRSVVIFWQDPQNKGETNREGLTGFWIQLQRGKSSIQNITTDKVNKYEIVNLTPYTTYEISVTAGNKHGFGNAGNISLFTTSEEGEITRIRFTIDALIIS